MVAKKKEHISPERDFLFSLFKMLKDKGIHYAVMRNYHALPNSLDSSDLDILVEERKRKQILLVLGQCVEKNWGAAIGVVRQRGFAKIFLFGGKHWNWGARLDITFRSVYGSVALMLDENVAFRHGFQHNGVSVMSMEDAAVLGVLKELLHNDRLPERYLGSAASAVTDKWEEVQATFSPIGGKALGLLRDICLSSADMPDLKKKSRQLRRSVLWHAFKRDPFGYAKGRVSHQWSRIERLISPPGLMVAILGTDGSGKSTVIDAITPVLESATHGAFYVQHLRPTLLPPLARLKGKTSGVQGPVTDPHGSKPSGIPGSLFRLAYLVADYVIGYWIKVRPRIAKSPAIVLFDRYAYDLEMDPRRFRIKLPNWLLHPATKMAPKPDLIFCLDGEAEEIQQRKKELPLEEVERQLAFIRDFAAHHPNAVLISTRGTVEETREQVLETLREYCLVRNPLNELS